MLYFIKCDNIFRASQLMLQRNVSLTFNLQKKYDKKTKPTPEKETQKKKEATSTPEKKTPKMKVFNIYRYSKENDQKPHMQKYTLDLNNTGNMILDALLSIKREQDSTLAFRKSCREGVCGSCAVNIDGRNALACLKKINPKGDTTIYPLPHMYVVKDLIVDFSRFLDQHRRMKPYLIRKNQEPIGKKQFLQSMKDRDMLDGYIECILCACCSTSCPEYWWHGHGNPKDFLGPAALLQVDRWLRDSRDEGTKERLDILKDYFSVYRCHQIFNCTSCCPKGLNPARAISNLRLRLGGFKSKNKPEMKDMA